MEADWLDVLRQRGEIARQVARIVPVALSNPALTVDLASHIHEIVERGAMDLDRTMRSMRENDVPERALEAADALRAVWEDLSIATADKLRTMQGLKSAPLSDLDE